MKMKILFAAAMIVGLGVQAQTYADTQGDDYTELVSMNNSDVKYYADNANYEMDKSGKISANIRSFYADGTLEEQGMLLHGEKHGTWTKFDENGNKVSTGKYNMGLKDGNWKVWDSNGTLRVEMNYENGKRTGSWKMFDENGNLVSEKDY